MGRDISDRQIELRLKTIEKNAAWIRKAELDDEASKKEALERLASIQDDTKILAEGISGIDLSEAMAERVKRELFGNE